MLCETCRQQDASVHLTEIRGSATTLTHLCATCAERCGVGDLASPFLPPELPDQPLPLSPDFTAWVLDLERRLREPLPEGLALSSEGVGHDVQRTLAQLGMWLRETARRYSQTLPVELQAFVDRVTRPST